jgi:two-component system, NtrC family, response regulator HydG
MSMPKQDLDWIDVGTEHLSARLRFNPDDAHIWLEDERMILLHVSAFARLRQELIERLGGDEARRILTRMGAASGERDAVIARRAMPHAGPVEAFKAGPRLHAIEGMVVPEEVALEVDPVSGFHFGEWIWRNSAEAEAHLQTLGTSTGPVCWTLSGYASAYSSAFMGVPIEYRELECKAMGAPQCRIVGRLASEWVQRGDASEELAIDLASTADADREALFGDVGVTPQRLPGEAESLLLGNSSEFSSVVASARRFAATDAPILVLGEPGSGKKSLARAIHTLSSRKSRRLLVVNCAAFDEDDLEVELFGSARTSLELARQGVMERATGGTVVLEDVQALPPRCQAKLLHMLGSGEIFRKGEFSPRPSNVRVLSCANAGLIESARAGRFRQDLYFRLSICPIEIPPLRERRADLPALIRHFLERFVSRHRKALSGITMEGVSYLLTHEFPGNVAELESIIERAVISAPEGTAIGLANLVSSADLHSQNYLQLSRSGSLMTRESLRNATQDRSRLIEQLLGDRFDLGDFEADLIATAVDRAGGNLSKAARALGMTRPQLAYRYDKLEKDAR